MINQLSEHVTEKFARTALLTTGARILKSIHPSKLPKGPQFSVSECAPAWSKI
jgi:hypothetical protein